MLLLTALVFTQLINKGNVLTSTKEEKAEKTLTAHDRCDGCGAQAYVKVTGVSGELYFCSHHFSNIMSNEQGKAKLEDFAYEIVDERDFLYV